MMVPSLGFGGVWPCLGVRMAQPSTKNQRLLRGGGPPIANGGFRQTQMIPQRRSNYEFLQKFMRV
jgi:hypothetical protein